MYVILYEHKNLICSQRIISFATKSEQQSGESNFQAYLVPWKVFIDLSNSSAQKMPFYLAFNVVKFIIHTRDKRN
jgi:hypothetical protein